MKELVEKREQKGDFMVETQYPISASEAVGLELYARALADDDGNGEVSYAEFTHHNKEMNDLGRDYFYTSSLPFTYEDYLTLTMASTGSWTKSMIWTDRGIVIPKEKELDKIEDSMYHSETGMALFKSQKINNAIEEFQKSKDSYPITPRSKYNLGISYHEQKRFKEAIAEFRKALELDPQNFFIHYNLGRTLLEDGQISEAITELKTAINIDGKAFIRSLLVVALLKSVPDDASEEESEPVVKECIDQVNKIIESDPRRWQSYVSMSILQGLINNIPEAVKAVLHALKINPNAAPAHYRLGEIYRQVGLAEKAIEEYLRSAKLEW